MNELIFRYFLDFLRNDKTFRQVSNIFWKNESLLFPKITLIFLMCDKSLWWLVRELFAQIDCSHMHVSHSHLHVC